MIWPVHDVAYCGKRGNYNLFSIFFRNIKQQADDDLISATDTTVAIYSSLLVIYSSFLIVKRYEISGYCVSSLDDGAKCCGLSCFMR